MTIDHLPGRTIQIDGKTLLFFSGTSYLGMGHQPAFRAALSAGIERYGTVFSASRNNNLQLDIYEKAESFLAQWLDVPAALTVTSGLFAGQLAAHFLGDRPFIYAPGAHPAIWQSAPQYLFANHADFAQRIAETVAALPDAALVIAFNAVDPLRCAAYDFAWIADLPHDKNLTLLVDDSHGIGVVNDGATGSAFLADIAQRLRRRNADNVQLVAIASLAKALGIPGGVILGEVDTIRRLRQNPLFVGASPIVPAYLDAFLAAQTVYQTARRALADNIQFFTQYLIQSGKARLFRFLPHYPVFFAKNSALYGHLYAHGIFISNFAYPKPDDPPITRIIISALHTPDDLRHLTRALDAFDG